LAIGGKDVVIVIDLASFARVVEVGERQGCAREQRDEREGARAQRAREGKWSRARVAALWDTSRYIYFTPRRESNRAARATANDSLIN